MSEQSYLAVLWRCNHIWISVHVTLSKPVWHFVSIRRPRRHLCKYWWQLAYRPRSGFIICRLHAAYDHKPYGYENVIYKADGWAFQWRWEDYRQTPNIRHTESRSINISWLVLQLSLPNPLKPYVKSRNKDVIGAAPTGNAPNISERPTNLLHTKVRLISKVSLSFSFSAFLFQFAALSALDLGMANDFELTNSSPVTQQFHNDHLHKHRSLMGDSLCWLSITGIR